MTLKENTLFKSKINNDQNVGKTISLEKVAFVLLILWCLMQAIMAFYCIIKGATHTFPPGGDSGLTNIIYTAFMSTSMLVYKTIGTAITVLGLIIFVLNLNHMYEIVSLKKHPWILLLMMLLTWSILSTMYSDEPLSAVDGGSYYCNGLFTYFVYAGIFICGSILKTENYRRNVFSLYSMVVTLLAIVMYAQLTKNEGVLYAFPTYLASVFLNTNHFGYALCMSLSLLAGLYIFGKDKSLPLRLWYLFQFAFQLVALLFNNTFGSYLAILCATIAIYIFYLRRKSLGLKEASFAKECVTLNEPRNKKSKYVWTIGFIFVVVTVINALNVFDSFNSLSTEFGKFFNDIDMVATGFSDGSSAISDSEVGHAGSGRWSLWVEAFEHIKERPIFGFGPAGFESPHCDPLQIAGFLGIPALFMYYGAMITLAIYLWKNISKLSETTLIGGGLAVCFLINGLFGHPMYNSTPTFWMTLGMITIMNPKDEVLLSSDLAINQNIDFKVKSQDKTAKKKNKIILYVLLIGFAYILISSVIYIALSNERGCEVLDLMAMEEADKAADDKVEELRNENLNAGIFTYIFDSNSLKLVDNTQNVLPYGCGTDRDGNGIKLFNSSLNQRSKEKITECPYEYDEKKDYTNSVIQVTIDLDKDKVDICWK